MDDDIKKKKPQLELRNVAREAAAEELAEITKSGKVRNHYIHSFNVAELVCDRGKCKCQEYCEKFVYAKLEPELLERYREMVMDDTRQTHGYTFSCCDIKQIFSLYSIGCSDVDVRHLVGVTKAITDDQSVRGKYATVRADLYHALKVLGIAALSYSLRKKLVDMAINFSSTTCLLFLAKAELGMSDNTSVSHDTNVTIGLSIDQLESQLRAVGWNNETSCRKLSSHKSLLMPSKKIIDVPVSVCDKSVANRTYELQDGKLTNGDVAPDMQLVARDEPVTYPINNDTNSNGIDLDMGGIPGGEQNPGEAL